MIVSSVRNPQLCPKPALTALKPPSGASSLPSPVVSPAGDRVVGTYPATMFKACADSSETLCWRVGLPNIVASPAGDRVVGTYPATMFNACADSFETTCRRIGLPIPDGAPADDRVIGTYPATMAPACADSFETTFRHIGKVFGHIGGGVAVWGCGVDGYVRFVLVAVQEGNELGSSQCLVRSEGGR